MIDIHHHLIFGLDDGPRDIEISLAMLEMARADGITHIVCTPHANHTWSYQPEENAARLAQIQQASSAGITLGLGCDFHLSYDNIQDALAHPHRYSLNGKNYLLVEFADFTIPQNISQTFYEMLLAGIIPVLTHPERNPILGKEPQRLAEWIRQGCLVQVTAGSVMGRFGKPAQRVAEQLLQDRWVHFLATDAHDIVHRPPLLREAYNAVARSYGADYAEHLCGINPRAAFYGESLPEQPQPVGIFEEAEPKRSLLSRIFSREE